MPAAVRPRFCPNTLIDCPPRTADEEEEGGAASMKMKIKRVRVGEGIMRAMKTGRI